MTAETNKRERTRQPVRVAKVREGVWQVSVRVVFPEDRSVLRERVRLPFSSKTMAIEWGQRRHAEIVRLGRAGYEAQKNPAPKVEVPTLREFFGRYLVEYCEAEQQKPSTIGGKRYDFSAHLDPALGTKRLNAISDANVQALKARLSAGRSAKTVDNVLGLLRNVLAFGVHLGVIASMPCKVLPVQSQPDADDGVPEFYEPDLYARIVDAARRCRRRDLVVVLLAGDAGLRRGEIIALEWTDIDFARNAINVRRSITRGKETAPKNGKTRRVPMTTRLAVALREQQGDTIGKVRVVRMDDGEDMTAKAIRCTMQRVERAAGMPTTGKIHILRHTFCSLLAMRGVPVDSIRTLAGHGSLGVTLRYMHLAPSALDDAIRVLEVEDVRTRSSPATGNAVATATASGA